MIGDYIGLAVYAPLFVFYCFVLKQYDYIYGEDRNIDSDVFRVLKEFHRYYFTGWNFTAQVLFLIAAIFDEVSHILQFNLTVRRVLSFIRKTIFSSVVFPCALLVSSLFWCLYLINRELVFPTSVDEFYPSWMNQCVHSVIILPPIVEVCLPQKFRVIHFKEAFRGLTTFVLVYQAVFFSVYFDYSIWLYPVFFHLTWIQRVIFLLIVYGLSVVYLSLGISLQKWRSPKGNEALTSTKSD